MTFGRLGDLGKSSELWGLRWRMGHGNSESRKVGKFGDLCHLRKFRAVGAFGKLGKRGKLGKLGKLGEKNATHINAF